MRPASAELGAKFPLIGGQYLPVLPCVHQLRHFHERRWLAGALQHAELCDFGQASAEVINAMAEVKTGIDINNVARAKIGHAAFIACRLDFTEAGSAGLGFVARGERACASPGRRISFRHRAYVSVHTDPAWQR